VEVVPVRYARITISTGNGAHSFAIITFGSGVSSGDVAQGSLSRGCPEGDLMGDQARERRGLEGYDGREIS
jgi:hypothetical protein